MSDARACPEGKTETQIDRRSLLISGGAAALGLAAYTAVRETHRPKASVFVARNQS